MSISIGMRGQAETLVTEDNIATAYGNKGMPVFATPCLIALFEQAAIQAVHSGLSPEEGTVGTMLHVTHDAATPLGKRVRAEAELISVEKRKLVFQVTAFDERGQIGAGIHERYIVNVNSFLKKTMEKE